MVLFLLQCYPSAAHFGKQDFFAIKDCSPDNLVSRETVHVFEGWGELFIWTNWYTDAYDIQEFNSNLYPKYINHLSLTYYSLSSSAMHAVLSMLQAWRKHLTSAGPNIPWNQYLSAQFSAGGQKVKAASAPQEQGHLWDCGTNGKRAALKGSGAPYPCWALLGLTISNSEPTRLLRYSLCRLYSWKYRTG